MHTTEGPEGTVFQHNGDYGGEVDIIVRAEPAQFGTPEGSPAWAVSIPFADVRSLVLGYLRDKRIAELESAGDDGLEKFLTHAQIYEEGS